MMRVELVPILPLPFWSGTDAPPFSLSLHSQHLLDETIVPRALSYGSTVCGELALRHLGNLQFVPARECAKHRGEAHVGRVDPLRNEAPDCLLIERQPADFLTGEDRRQAIGQLHCLKIGLSEDGRGYEYHRQGKAKHRQVLSLGNVNDRGSHAAKQVPEAAR